MIKKHILISSILALFISNSFAQTFSADASYYSEVIANLKGGIKTGVGYEGFLFAGINFNTNSAHNWESGSFRISVGNTHGGTPSATLIGDYQVASNIEAGNHTFLYEFWYKQQIDNWTFSIGLQDINANNYAACGCAADFLNSSFGTLPPFSNNFAAPIFPITGLGIDLSYRINQKIDIKTALFDGNVLDFDENPYNLHWNLSPQQGYLSISEIIYNTKNKNLEGNYILGVYYHTELSSSGVYATAGQDIWVQNSQKLQLFAQACYIQKKENENYMHVGGGFNFDGLFSKQGNDRFGIAVTTAFLQNKKNETAVETFYKYQINKHVFMQPDLQYIINPSGTDEILPNALVAFIRFGIEF